MSVEGQSYIIVDDDLNIFFLGLDGGVDNFELAGAALDVKRSGGKSSWVGLNPSGSEFFLVSTGVEVGVKESGARMIDVDLRERNQKKDS